jgi:hypothetical protein
MRSPSCQGKLSTGLFATSFSLPRAERFWPIPVPTLARPAPVGCSRDLSSRHPLLPGIAKSHGERPNTHDAEGSLPRRLAVNRCMAVAIFGNLFPGRDALRNHAWAEGESRDDSSRAKWIESHSDTARNAPQTWATSGSGRCQLRSNGGQSVWGRGRSAQCGAGRPATRTPFSCQPR